MAEQKFPTETVELPSKGYFYFEGHPLSSGKVEIKYMTAKEEDILTSPNLIKQGTVIDKLLNALIIDKSINVEDMITGDKNAIMIAARILGYGKDYPITYDGQEHTADLSKLEPRKIDFSKLVKGQNEFSFKLPVSERDITFKILNGKEEREIDLELKAKEKISKETSANLTTRLKKMILSVDGNSDKAFINNFVDNEFLSRDSYPFRENLLKITPDIDMKVKVKDSNGEDAEVMLPITLRFFWPSSGI